MREFKPVRIGHLVLSDDKVDTLYVGQVQALEAARPSGSQSLMRSTTAGLRLGRSCPARDRCAPAPRVCDAQADGLSAHGRARGVNGSLKTAPGVALCSTRRNAARVTGLLRARTGPDQPRHGLWFPRAPPAQGSPHPRAGRGRNSATDIGVALQRQGNGAAMLRARR